jgi:adenine C2-methylase RlmN of 23S rRNA A2503 and tRNA A37
MVRGEPLANPSMLQSGFQTLQQLAMLAHEHELIPKFNVSTIMPKEVRNIRLARSFAGIYPTIYYSLYSLDPAFRKKWMPAALNPLRALDILAEYQQDSKKLIKIHGCIIENENDQPETWINILEQIRSRDLKVDFNLVRYNPFSSEWGQEAAEEKMVQLNTLISDYTTSKVVSRVGFDVKASCGMFID